MVRQVLLVPLLEQFICDSKNGKRRKRNGERLKQSTVDNYRETLKLVVAYEAYLKTPFYLTVNIRNNQRLIIRERNYWKAFYQGFTDYLLYHKGFYDNYTGSIFKVLKCFFRYLKYEKYLLIQECYETFYVRKEDIRVIALLPEQYCFLILDKAFEQSLTIPQKRCKDLFVFGCTAAMRYSDLCKLQVKDVEVRCGNYYLHFISQKTGTPIQVKLPGFAVDIYKKYARYKKPSQRLFPSASPNNFDERLKAIGQKAGWTEITGKLRAKNGVHQEVKRLNKQLYRFCDQLSSHLMRKTRIAVLLMLGMPEYLVRKISGHSSGSKEFFRYVNFAESYISDELDKAHQKLLTLYQA
jgi:integrase